MASVVKQAHTTPLFLSHSPIFSSFPVVDLAPTYKSLESGGSAVKDAGREQNPDSHMEGTKMEGQSDAIVPILVSESWN